MNQRTHTLKTWESAFLAVRAGTKKAEFRRNDRDFAVGDIVVLERWRPGFYDRTGRGAAIAKDGTSATGVVNPVDTITVRITHMIEGVFGIPEGFCMFSFEHVEPAP